MERDYLIIPIKIARTVDPVGYFRAFYEFKAEEMPGASYKATFYAFEEVRELAGLPPKYSDESSFRKAKHTFDAGKFSGQVKYI